MNVTCKEGQPIQICSMTDWVIRHGRLGNDAAIAILSHGIRGTRSVVAVRNGPDLDAVVATLSERDR